MQSIRKAHKGASRRVVSGTGVRFDVTHQIVETILAGLPFRRGDETAMLVNALRSTPLTELYIVFRKTAQMLDAAVFLADVDGGTAA